jgi:hypothetical protein
MLVGQVAPLLQVSLLKACVTNCTKQSPPWEVNRSTACQEIPLILLNSDVHYRIHKTVYIRTCHTLPPIHCSPEYFTRNMNR